MEAWGAHPCGGFDFVRPAGAISRPSAWKCVPLGDLVGVTGHKLLDGRPWADAGDRAANEGARWARLRLGDLEHTRGMRGCAQS